MKNKQFEYSSAAPLCLVIIIFLSVNLQAQESVSLQLSIDEAVDLAIINNLSLESSRTNLATRRRASDLSLNQFLPSITVSGTLNRDNQAGTASGMFPVDMAPALNPIYDGINKINEALNPLAPPPPIPLLPSNQLFGVVPFSAEIPQWRVVGNIQTSLTLSAAMFENIRRLRLDYEIGLLSYEKAKAQLERDVRKAYHNMLLLHENIELIRGSFANVERQVQIAQANYNAGFMPELTLLQARVARENMRPLIDQVENGLKLSMAQFGMFLGLPYDTQFELIPITESINFIPFDVAEMISQAASGKPDINELRHTILMLESLRKMQALALAPSLTLGWNNTSILSDPWNKPWFGSDSEWRNSGSFSITFALRLHSLFPFSTDSQGIKNLDDQIRTSNIGLAQMIRGTEIEVYSIVLALERIRISAEAQEQTINLAEQAFRLTEQAYRAGLQDYFQVQSAEQALHQARVQLLELQFNYLNSLIDLEYATGVPFGTLSGRSR